jgi:hypothetical protein
VKLLGLATPAIEMIDDDTAAAETKLGAAVDDTAVIPDDLRVTHAAPALAWSSEELDTDDFAEPDWTGEDDAYSRGTVVMFVGLMAVAVIAAAWMSGMWLKHHNNDSPAPPAPATKDTQYLPVVELHTKDEK